MLFTIVEMRLIPFVLCAILVVATAAPNPGSYSSSNHYQFQRSSSAYRNNELQHKEEEIGAYGRIENPDKYDKPLEQSHYRQTSYNAPGADSDEDTSDEDEYPSQTTGVKGGRPNSFTGYGHSANYHIGSEYLGQGVFVDSDDTTDDHFVQPGRRYHHHHGFYHPPGFNNPPGNHYGHHQHRGYHHGHGYHQHHHGFEAQETSSQSSGSVSTTQNNGNILIPLDQTFDYSKFMEHGFGKEYLENTEGQRVTTPQSIITTTENIKPVFEVADEIPEQPAFSSQMGNNGRGIQSSANTFGQNSQQGQVFSEDQSTTGQIGFANQMGNNGNFNTEQQQGQSTATTFGQNSQQGQIFTEDQLGSASQIANNDGNQRQIDFGQSFLQGQNTEQTQNLDLSTFGQNSQQGQVFNEDQSTVGQIGSSSQIGNDDGNQRQIDIGQSFLQGQSTGAQTFQQGQSNSGQTFQQGQSNSGQNFQQGQSFQRGISEVTSQQNQNIDLSLFDQNSQQGQVFNENQSTERQIGSASQIGNDDGNQRQINFGQTFQQGQSTSGQTFQQGQSNSGQTFQQGQTFQSGSQTGDHLIPVFDEIDKIGSMYSRDQTNTNYGSHHNYGSGRHHHEIMHHTTGYIKPKYETDFTQQETVHHKPDYQFEKDDSGKMEFASHHKEEEEKVEEKTREEKTEENAREDRIEEMSTQETFQEITTEASQQENNNQEMTNQDRQNDTVQGNFNTFTENEQTTTEYYKYHNKHEKEYGQIDYDEEKDLTQHTQHSNDKVWNGDFHQHQDQFGSFDYDGQHQEDLTQQTQDSFGRIEFDGKDLTQQHQDGWSQLGAENQEDLSQKQQKQDEEFGHLKFGGQQQEDLSQKNENFGYGNNGYRNSYGYSTASSRSSSSSFSYGRTYNIQTADQTEDLAQKQEQFATEVQDVSQQVQKVENLNLEEQKETPFEPEEIAVVVEEKTTEKPSFWRRLGGSISRTYQNAKEKVKNNIG